jgi:hypothetical protein
MKTVVLGDIHGLGVWELIVAKESPDRVIFLGDYFDSTEVSTSQQINNYNKIVEFKKSGGADIIMLVGNHDFHYLPYIDTDDISGFQSHSEDVLKELVGSTLNNLTMCYKQGNYLFTHAGVSDNFLLKAQINYSRDTIDSSINTLFLNNPHIFDFDEDCEDASGDNKEQSCIWIRPRSLMNNSHTIKKDYIQIVGHTTQKRVDVKGVATDGRFYFLDTLRTSGQYGIIEFNNITFNSYK